MQHESELILHLEQSEESHTFTHITSNPKRLTCCFAGNGQPNSKTVGIGLAVKMFKRYSWRKTYVIGSSVSLS